jgi:putative DNA primase/helicase
MEAIVSERVRFMRREFLRRNLVGAERARPVEAKEPGPVLLAAAPFDTAKEFAKRHCQSDGVSVEWFWQGEFYRWNGMFYEVVSEREIRGRIYVFLDGASKWAKPGQTMRFQPTKRNVDDVLDGLKTGLALPEGCAPPRRLDTGEEARDVVVFRNKAVNVVTEEEYPLSPMLWVHGALDFEWNPDAPAPLWMKFLEEVLPGDQDAKNVIEEFLGLCMTEETKFQKALMLIGRPRSGRGTISHVLRKLVGEGYAPLSFHSWARGENSREPLIGKRVGVFADVRFKAGRMYGQSYDPGGIDHVSAELLLNITGQDELSIPRKYIGAWHGRLPMKIVVISNEVPNLNDGVLPGRFIKVWFNESFCGREDVELRSKLEGELPGIAVRCVRAYQRLCERGKFIQPATANALELEALAAIDPYAEMAHDCFVVDPQGSVTKVVAYARFARWCLEHDRLDLQRTTPDNRLGNRLKEVLGFEHIFDHRPRLPDGSLGPRRWGAMRLKEDE